MRGDFSPRYGGKLPRMDVFHAKTCNCLFRDVRRAQFPASDCHPAALRLLPALPAHAKSADGFLEPVPCRPGLLRSLGEPTQDGRKKRPVEYRRRPPMILRSPGPKPTAWARARYGRSLFLQHILCFHPKEELIQLLGCQDHCILTLLIEVPQDAVNHALVKVIVDGVGKATIVRE